MIVIPEQAKKLVAEKLAETIKFAAENGHLGKFLAALDRLERYGCDEDFEGTKYPKCKVLLYTDSSNYSFGLQFTWRDDKNLRGEYKPGAVGGLIYHDSDKSWGVHT